MPPRHRFLAVRLAVALVAFPLLAATPQGAGQAARLRERLYRAFEWERAVPEAHGLDGTVLDGYVAAARAGVYGEIHSLLVARHGVLVLEQYFHGYGPSTLHRVYSVTKSVTSLLVGVAHDDRLLADLNAPLLSFFPEYPHPRNLDDRKRRIRLVDALSMRAGFEWDESTYPYTDSRNPVSQMMASGDWIAFVLDRPMAAEPGARFRYNSGVSVLLGGVVRRACSVDAQALAVRRLFGPLGIEDVTWDRGARGVVNTGFGLWLRPLDMARIGLLLLRQGDWLGRRIVSSEWLNASTSRYVNLSQGFGYGYQWWQMPLSPGSLDVTGPEVRFAWGWGGQYIYVVPSLDVVVVATGGDYQAQLEGAINFVREMLRDALLH